MLSPPHTPGHKSSSSYTTPTKSTDRTTFTTTPSPFRNFGTPNFSPPTFSSPSQFPTPTRLVSFGNQTVNGFRLLSEEQVSTIQEVRRKIIDFSRTQNHEADLFLQEFRKSPEAWEIIFEIMWLEFRDSSVIQDTNERFLCAQLLYMKMIYNFHQLIDEDMTRIEIIRRYLLKSITLFYYRSIQSNNNGDKLVTGRLCLALCMFTLHWILHTEVDLNETDIFREIFNSGSQHITFEFVGNPQHLNFNAITFLNTFNNVNDHTNFGNMVLDYTEPVLDWLSCLLEQMETVTIFTVSQTAELKKEIRKMENRFLDYLLSILNLPFPPKTEALQHAYVFGVKSRAIKALKSWINFGISSEYIYQNDAILQILFSTLTQNEELFIPSIECLQELFQIGFNSKYVDVLKKYISLATTQLRPVFDFCYQNLDNDRNMNICREIIKLCALFAEKSNMWVLDVESMVKFSQTGTLPPGTGVLNSTAKNLMDLFLHFGSCSDMKLVELTHNFWYYFQTYEPEFGRVLGVNNLPEELRKALNQVSTAEVAPYYRTLMDQTMRMNKDPNLETLGLVEFDLDDIETFRESSREIYISAFNVIRTQCIEVCEANLKYISQSGNIFNLSKYMAEFSQNLATSTDEAHFDTLCQLLVKSLPDWALLESTFSALHTICDAISPQDSQTHTPLIFSHIRTFADVLISLSKSISDIQKGVYDSPYRDQILGVVFSKIVSYLQLKETDCDAGYILWNVDSYISISLLKSTVKLIERFAPKIVKLDNEAMIWSISFAVNSMTGFQEFFNQAFSLQKKDLNNIKAFIFLSATCFCSLCENGSKICKNENDGSMPQLLFNMVQSLHSGNILKQVDPSVSITIHKGLGFVISSLEILPEKQQELLRLVLQEIFLSFEKHISERKIQLEDPTKNVFEQHLLSSIDIHYEIRKIICLIGPFGALSMQPSSDSQNPTLDILLKVYESIMPYTAKLLFYFVKYPTSKTFEWGKDVTQHLICKYVAELWQLMSCSIGCTHPSTFSFHHTLLRMACQFFCFGKVMEMEETINEDQLLQVLTEIAAGEPTMENISEKLGNLYSGAQPYPCILDLIAMVFNEKRHSLFSGKFMLYFTPIFLLCFNLTKSNIFETRQHWLSPLKSKAEKFSPLLVNQYSDDERGDLLISLFRLLSNTWRTYTTLYMNNSIHLLLLDKIEELCLNYMDYENMNGLNADDSTGTATSTKSVSSHISTFLQGFLNTDPSVFENTGADSIYYQETLQEKIREISCDAVPSLLKCVLLSESPNLSYLYKMCFSFMTQNKTAFLTYADNYCRGKDIQELVNRNVLQKSEVDAFKKSLFLSRNLIALRRSLSEFKEKLETAQLMLSQSGTGGLVNIHEESSVPLGSLF